MIVQIPTVLSIYEDADGNRLAKYETGKDKWVMVSAGGFTGRMKQLSCSFVTDEDVAECLPLKCISNREIEGE